MVYTQQNLSLNYSYMQFIFVYSTDLHASKKTCSLSHLKRPSWIELFEMWGHSLVFMQLLALMIQCTIFYWNFSHILGGLVASMPAIVPDVNVQKLMV